MNKKATNNYIKLDLYSGYKNKKQTKNKTNNKKINKNKLKHTQKI